MKEQSANLRAAEASRTTQPAFLFRIAHGATVLFYTSYDKDIVIEGGSGLMADPQTFQSVNIDHDPPSESADTSNQPVVVALASSDTNFRKYFLTAPTKEISISIWRINSSSLPGPIDFADLYRDFFGVCQSVSFAGYQIEASFLAMPQEDSTVPKFYYQKTCNHNLFSEFCTVVKNNFKIVTTLSSVDRINKTVGISDVSVNVDSPPRSVTISGETLQGGRLVDADGNEIGIVACEVLESGERLLWLNWWPGTLAVSSPVTIYLGCLKIVRICDEVFDNKENFGGHPYIPKTNPVSNSIIT